MGSKDRRVDAYIAKAGEFARPILNHIRETVHAACPDVEETIKWGFPNFLHKGMLCSMAAFKAHCSMGFWKSRLIFGKSRSAPGAKEKSMGSLGRITSLADLPADSVLRKYIRTAMELNEAGTKSPPRKRTPTRKELTIPPYFMAAVRKNAKARATFEGFSYSHKKEYVDWVTGAKQEETRDRRLAQAVQLMAQGKSQYWKYER